MSFFDVNPDAVASAGRSTSATASSWESWANKSENLLRNAASDAHDSTFSAALEGYLSQLNPTMHSVGKEVDAVGTNTVSAAHTVTNSDTEASHQLSQHGRHLDHEASTLRRPINP